MHGCLCEWERGTWHSSCPTCRGSTDSWAQGGLIPPPPPPPITTFPLTSLLLSHLLHLSLSPSPSIYSLLFQTYWPSFFRTLACFPTLFSHFISSTALFVHTVSSLFLSASLHIFICFFFSSHIRLWGNPHKATQLAGSKCLIDCCFHVCLPDEQLQCN